MNENQYSFRPQKYTVDAAMSTKGFVQQGREAVEVIALVSLNVQGAFKAASWPWVLNELRKYQFPKTYLSLKKVIFLNV